MQEDETGLPSPSDAHTLMLWLSRTWALSPFSVPRDLPSVRPGTLLLSPETLAAPPDLVSLILPSVLLTALALNPNSASVKCIWIKVLPFPTRSEAEHHTLLKSTCPCTRGAREHPGFKRILEVVPDLLCECLWFPRQNSGLLPPTPGTSTLGKEDPRDHALRYSEFELFVFVFIRLWDNWGQRQGHVYHCLTSKLAQSLT